MNCCFRIAPIARATPSMSALTKFSVTASPRARAEAACANTAGAGSSAAANTAVATAAGNTRPRGWKGALGFMLIRSI